MNKAIICALAVGAAGGALFSLVGLVQLSEFSSGAATD